MKTKIYGLLASVMLIATSQAGNQVRGGSGGHFSAPAPRGGGGASFRSAPMQSFGGNRMMYSSQRFSSVGSRSPSSVTFHPNYINSNANASLGVHQFNPGVINRGNFTSRFGNVGNQSITNTNKAKFGSFQNGKARDRFAQFGKNSQLRPGGNGLNQIRNGNNLPGNWRNHVVAQHSANWHHDWDRSRDHNWNGHHCRFINGSWFVFDVGFYPWWWYGYPSDYYYPGYYYDPYVYDDADYYGQNGYPVDQSGGSLVAAAQQELARQGYYNGAIDGIVGAETRRAIARYQSSHGLRVTGALTSDTLNALGLPQVASY